MVKKRSTTILSSAADNDGTNLGDVIPGLALLEKLNSVFGFLHFLQFVADDKRHLWNFLDAMTWNNCHTTARKSKTQICFHQKYYTKVI